MKKEYFLVILIVLLSLASFGLGRLSVSNSGANRGEEVEFIIPELSLINLDEHKKYPFLASINGTKYYPNGCKSANRIKSDNRLYFKTAEDAVKSGYSRTSSC